MVTNRDPESVAFEADYWKAILDDMSQLNTLIEEAAHSLADAVIPLLALSILTDNSGRDDGVKASEAVNATMKKLAAMQQPIFDMLETAKGRVLVLEGELA